MKSEIHPKAKEYIADNITKSPMGIFYAPVFSIVKYLCSLVYLSNDGKVIKSVSFLTQHLPLTEPL